MHFKTFTVALLSLIPPSLAEPKIIKDFEPITEPKRGDTIQIGSNFTIKWDYGAAYYPGHMRISLVRGDSLDELATPILIAGKCIFINPFQKHVGFSSMMLTRVNRKCRYQRGLIHMADWRLIGRRRQLLDYGHIPKGPGRNQLLVKVRIICRVERGQSRLKLFHFLADQYSYRPRDIDQLALRNSNINNYTAW